MTTELDKFQAGIDKKFIHFNEELTDSKSSVIEQLDTKFKLVDDNFKTLETNILSRVDFIENSVNIRMDCIDDKINILNDKLDHIHDQVIKLDEKVDKLEIKVDINHAIVMDKVDLQHKLALHSSMTKQYSSLLLNKRCKFFITKSTIMIWLLNALKK